ncbi:MULTISPECIES: alginate lyase family protein [unclassified Pseudoalteromonas]|uniref:alginate lyase family protein n=1 Tax=unclassified Pseudoalteromonas TaxID=194690 RepID=UPI0025B40240|nr:MULTISPECIES: alginate lyase family protein [unclassified Pseudoalteromonas]MDN3379768.1 alginate lyase family protein [Pseudoalteromonas sp. APC 3893]MDN3388106.1 alginate lyase family protein [Pseudoalteromonas sp. APC 4017]
MQYIQYSKLSLKSLLLSSSLLASSVSLANEHPNLVLTQADVTDMRQAVDQTGSFSKRFNTVKSQLDAQLNLPITVPLPKDAGGGYTHERHKENYKLMYQAGVLYQLSGEPKYAQYVRDMLLEYVNLYPKIGLHPKRKNQNPGKLFWQILNEAVWLVHTIQAYDAVASALSEDEQQRIENGILKPVAAFLSTESPGTFDKVHNHGTWATAAVGMTGYVIDDQKLVEQALYGLDKSGKAGFLRQVDELFSPQGYYTEGPYYQRYALLPFITFAKAIANNEPKRDIFGYRDGVILKAIKATIDLSYNGLFFGINDAIKDKGIDTVELVQGVTIAYGLTGDPQLLDIAKRQEQIILTGDGLKVANALDAHKEQSYQFTSQEFGDGSSGKDGALVVLRAGEENDQTVVFKATSQGMGHGHFDKLNWIFYDHGNEIVTDYGAARFLNVEAKFGGRYLPENNSFAKQTIAHNTVIVDETSHFNGDVTTAEKYAPTVHYFVDDKNLKLTSASIDTAYDGVNLSRTMALLTVEENTPSVVIDIFDVQSDKPHQYDLPLQYNGHFIDSNFAIKNNSEVRRPLGKQDGYEHLWLTASAKPESDNTKITWLNSNGRFYTQTSVADDNTHILFTQTGANDPNFNLRNQSAFIQRVENTNKHQFISVIEPHGEYNPSKEYTLQGTSRVSQISSEKLANVQVVEIKFINGKTALLAINQNKELSKQSFSYKGKKHTFGGRYLLVQ